MFKKIYRKLKKDSYSQPIQGLPCVLNTTFRQIDNQWYLPTMIGPQTVISEITSVNSIQSSQKILEKLTPDRYSEFVVSFYKQGLERFGNNWVYSDINTILLGISKMIQPQSYLEIGVRRGRSMAMVASQAPKCNITGFDMWVENYAGMDNPGTEFVREELKKVGFEGNLKFIDGDSKKTIPQYFKVHPDEYFDIITVDGDHSLEGARADLLNVIPHVKVGGFLIFDDISNQSFSYLDNLWNEIVVSNPQFAAYSFTEVGFGVGFAIKKY